MNFIENGVFGGALNGRFFCCEASAIEAYTKLPLTVECWVKVDTHGMPMSSFISCGHLEHPQHWDISAGFHIGEARGYVTGFEPSETVDRPDIADGKWHYIAMILEESRIRLYADGKLSADANLTPRNLPPQPFSGLGPLYIGGYPPNEVPCNGLIDEVRISKGIRDIQGVPEAPFEVDEMTIGLWHFDDIKDGIYEDSSPLCNILKCIPYSGGDSLDKRDNKAFGVETNPFMRSMKSAIIKTKRSARATGSARFGAEERLLDGSWECVDLMPHGRSEEVMLTEPNAWNDSFVANVPCSIQTALFEDGRIPDPMVLKNDQDIQWVAEHEWWLRREFDVSESLRGKRITLEFDGVDYSGTFWLNGYKLGQHEGMFGGPQFDVTSLVRYGRENTLIVRIDPAPTTYAGTFKSNVAYGWHYVKLITLGIWRSVRLQARGYTSLDHPFMRVAEILPDGIRAQLSVDMWHWGEEPASIDFECCLTPKNFDGDSFCFNESINVQPGQNQFGFELLLKDAKLWWPIGMGDPNLYYMECIIRDGDEVIDCYSSNWGAKTVEMRPNSDGPRPNRYNWQAVINGRPIWLKGANWCLPDAMLRLDLRNNRRFIEMARGANIQLLRVWGGGPVENDELYDVCDELGMLVQQEFSTMLEMGNTSIHSQNMMSSLIYDITDQQVRRLRNRPSLAMWHGSNEGQGRGRMFEILGRRCLELDSTHPFHRTCPFGGDFHWYGVYWGGLPVLDYCTVTGNEVALTEFGLSSPANMETWRKILPRDEWEVWPPARNSAFIHHTPTWDYCHVDLMNRYAGDFLIPTNLPELVEGMQLAQGLGLKICIEHMRAQKPRTTATYFYKLTENYPSSSWATIDYYGRPKLSHYYVRDAYAPVHVMATYEQWDSKDGMLPLTISAVNDTDKDVMVTIRACLYDGMFNILSDERFDVSIPIDRAIVVSDKTYCVANAKEKPVFLHLDMINEAGIVVDRNWYHFDFAGEPGCLFSRPKTSLNVELVAMNGQLSVAVKNTGKIPAISVNFSLGEASNTYYVEDNGLWLNPGEERVVPITRVDAIHGDNVELDMITISAWNVEPLCLEYRVTLPDAQKIFQCYTNTCLE